MISATDTKLPDKVEKIGKIGPCTQVKEKKKVGKRLSPAVNDETTEKKKKKKQIHKKKKNEPIEGVLKDIQYQSIEVKKKKHYF